MKAGLRCRPPNKDSTDQVIFKQAVSAENVETPQSSRKIKKKKNDSIYGESQSFDKAEIIKQIKPISLS